MAEILGIAESIAAICGAGDSAFKMARSMKRLSRDLGAARKDIRNFSRDIDAFSSIIGAAHYTLETHSKPESRSKVLVFIHKRQILDQLVDQSDRVIDHIRELRPSIKSLKSSISWVTRVKWVLRRTDVKALGPKMESVKTSLNLLITMFSYEAIMQSIGLQVNTHNITDSTNREMRRLRRDMQRVMEQIAESQERQQQQPHHNWESPENTFVDVQLDIQEALVELGQSIVENNSVPDVENSSTSSRTLRPDLGRPVVPVFSERRRTSPVSSQRHVRHRRSPIRERIVEERAPVPAPTEVFIHQEDEQELSGPKPKESLALEVKELPAERSDSDPGEGPSTFVIEREDESPVSTPRDADGDFISVQKTKRKIYFNPAIYHETISGYIATSHGPAQVTALLDRNIPENIISLALASKLGLEIELYDSNYDKDGDWKWIRFGDGEEKKSRGRVVLKWSQGAFLTHAPLKVHCWVFGDEEEDVLVLGGPFVSKRRHYWEDNEVEER